MLDKNSCNIAMICSTFEKIADNKVLLSKLTENQTTPLVSRRLRCRSLSSSLSRSFLWWIKQEYCDDTLSMFVLRLRNIVYDTTGAEAHCRARLASSARSFSAAGACAISARAQELGQFIIRMKICENPFGAIMVNGPSWELPQLLMESPRRILKVPLGISFGLHPQEISWGTFNILPRTSIEYS